MQQQVMESLSNKKADMKNTVQKWNSEKEANESAIAQMRANKEARKKEMEEMEKMKAKMLAEQEQEQSELQVDTLPEDTPKKEEKKDEKPADTNHAFKSKEQVELEEALSERVRPLAIGALDSDQLKERVQEYWKTYSSLKKEKEELGMRFSEQDQEIKDAQERLAEIVMEKQAKKGVDMVRLALGPGGKPSKHPPKKQMYSKHINQAKGARNFEDRKDMYDEGVDEIRPKLLASVWQAKFSAWMDDEAAGSYLDGEKEEDALAI